MKGDLLYRSATALPVCPVRSIRNCCKQTDRMIKSVPEVKRVFRQGGSLPTLATQIRHRLTLFRRPIQFKPADQWRPGMTPEKLVKEARQGSAGGLGLGQPVDTAQFATVSICWPRHQGGGEFPIGVKVYGFDLVTDWNKATQRSSASPDGSGVSSAGRRATQPVGALYRMSTLDRSAAARYGLNISEVQSIVAGGRRRCQIGENRRRAGSFIPISLRYPREWR